MSLHLDDQPDTAAADSWDPEVSIRRNVVLSGVVGGLAAVLGLAFLIRSGNGFDTLIGVVLLLLAALNLPALASARVPVLVADDHGLRLRVGVTWRGLPWAALRQVVVEYADGPLREGRLVIVPRDQQATLRRLDPLAKLHLSWNRAWYGASLAVPLGMTTVVDSGDLAGELAGFADGRVEVVHLRGRELSRLGDDVVQATGVHEAAPAPVLDYADEGQPVPDEGDAPIVIAHRPADPPAEEPALWAQALPEPVQPLRDLSTPRRVDVRLDAPTPADPDADLGADAAAEHDPATEATVSVRPDRAGGPAWEDLPIDVVVDDLAARRPAAIVPVIGPKIAHARECLDMTIDELSQRTRIRPHVLEAIEVDDFGPCGGDFYARGHLTAVARALGLTLEPLLQQYDELYSQAPINARRVFEAELSSGLSGGMRATLGGPRWSLLIGSVLCLTMVWGLARMFAGDPEQLATAPQAAQTAGLSANHTPITSEKMRTTAVLVTARFAGTHVVVADRTGKTLWSGDLGLGKKRKIIGLAPFTVSADNAGAVEVTLKGQDRGTLGTAGEPGSKKFGG